MHDLKFSPDNITIHQAATHPDGSFMFTAHLNDHPDVLYAFDKVSLKEDCEGGWFLEYTMQIAAKKDSKEDEETVDVIGQNLIQYLFQLATTEPRNDTEHIQNLRNDPPHT